jgi:hypothetical protein
MAPAGQPSARYYHVAFWTGTDMLVWGGEPHSDIALVFWADGALFQP